jgi:predicted RNA-binding protein with PIN domain
LKHHRITVVFDGINAPPHSQNRDYVKGIDIHFSHRGESADAVIKRMAAKEKELALIVSSDHEVVDFAASRGAATISSPAFEEKIVMAAHMAAGGVDEPEGRGGWIPTTKKKGPRKRLSKRKRRNRIKIRKL